jgi:hypothetical protein
MEFFIWGMIKTWLHIFVGVGVIGSILLIGVKLIRWFEENRK